MKRFLASKQAAIYRADIESQESGGIVRNIRLRSLIVTLAGVAIPIILLIFPGNRFAVLVILGLGVLGGLSWWRMQREDESDK